MEKQKNYQTTFFKPQVIKQAFHRLLGLSNEEKSYGEPTMEISNAHGSWRFDNLEEFLSEYKPDVARAYFDHIVGKHRLIVMFWPHSSTVTVRATSREEIETIFNIFEEQVADSKIPVPEQPAEKPVIFIGHGRSLLWRDLKDHLQDKHGYEVVAYEVGSRAGHTIRDILEEMLDESSCAFLVLTGEDETTDGKLLARQNVVHETGLFQGRLGFSRAIVLLEEGTEEFSNIAGIQQIRFSKGNIKETFGEVLAILRREFGS
jgi:predicted nucleotide-binding protein